MIKLKSTTLFCLVLFIFMLVVPFSHNNVHAINSNDKDTKTIKEEKIKKSIEKRKEFGFDSDYNKVEKYYEDGTFSKTYGFYMSQKEEDDFTKRINNQKSNVPKIKEYINNNPKLKENYVDLYIDQSSGGTVNVIIKPGKNNGLKSEQDTLKTKFNSLPINYKELQFSEADLNKLTKSITDNLDEFKKMDIDINYIRPDLINQNIIIGILQGKVSSDFALNKISSISGLDSNLLKIEQNATGITNDSTVDPIPDRAIEYRPLIGGILINTKY